MHDCTPRHYGNTRSELMIDVVLHSGGPASLWAAQRETYESESLLSGQNGIRRLSTCR